MAKDEWAKRRKKNSSLTGDNVTVVIAEFNN